MATVPPSVTSVLIVDDERSVRDIMARWAASHGCETDGAANAVEALATLDRHHYDMAIVDIMMPGHDGIWLANELKQKHPDTAVVLATGYTDLLGTDNHDLPVADLLIKPFERCRFLLAIDRGRQWRKEASAELHWQAQLALELEDRVAGLRRAIERTPAGAAGELDLMLTLVSELAPDVLAHGERVARFCVSVARELGIEAAAVRLLEDAARLHDLGKLAVPEAVLTKPSPLSIGELTIMKRHVEAGADLLSASRTLRDLAPIVMASHEWIDGRGYPAGLCGDAIPLASRIITVCDAYDAMTEHRHYRAGLDSAEAVSEILRCTRTQFDPEVVAAFLTVLGRH
jgi:response regulator RpfG family c-di-GMP phosphodiesterase